MAEQCHMVYFGPTRDINIIDDKNIIEFFFNKANIDSFYMGQAKISTWFKINIDRAMLSHSRQNITL